MSFTLSTLTQAIKDFTENTESSFVANINTFIKLSEERILKSVQLDLFRKTLQDLLRLPTNTQRDPLIFSAFFTFCRGKWEKEFVEFKDVSFVQTFNPDATVTGTPLYYSVFDVNNFILGPTPNAALNAELHYFYRPTSLVDDSSGTTWLSENAELTLLYGCLIEAYLFMKGEQDVMAMYDKRFQESLVGLKLLGEAKETTQDYRVGRVIIPKQQD